ncbi:hypothetical protein T484DRAFT_1783257 [Baffinella frigidus]|nr:hypothetical protein T484DRAFT_1783257 [Cryptophyta sp. CCMP2293]
MRGPFSLYLASFDRIFETVSTFKATHPEVAQIWVEPAAAGDEAAATRVGLASALALPITSLARFQELLVAYRALVQPDVEPEEAARASSGIEAVAAMRRMVAVHPASDRLGFVAAMRRMVAVHPASDRSVRELVRLEQRMALLALSDVVGAAVSIVKLGRQVVHTGRLFLLQVSIVKLGRQVVHTGRLFLLQDDGEGTCEQETETESYLFSDLLLCCEAHPQGLIARHL